VASSGPAGTPSRSSSQGASLTAARGETAKKELKISWNFPVYTPPEERGTRAPSVEKNLALPKVYEVLAGDDKRPLLILREFDSFDDPDNEKLSSKLYTEKTVLLAHWFNCIRLPHHVTKDDHPFHNLFTGNDPPQLLVVAKNGDNLVPFNYTSSRANMLKYMTKYLDYYYAKSPSKVVSSILKMLPKFDKLDKEIQSLKEDLDEAIEKNGPRSGKTKKLRKLLARAQSDFKALEEKKKELRKIPLKEERETSKNDS